MNRVLITGGTGCVGSNLASVLSGQGVAVRVLRRPGSDLRALGGIDASHAIGDLLHPDELREAVRGCDTVFHTAALVSFAKKDRERQLQVNVTGTRNVVDACLAEGVGTLVHTSSVAVIGYRADGAPSDESTEYNWSTSAGYRMSKLLAEKEVHTGISRGLRSVIVNPSVIVGERDIHFHGGQIVRDIRRGLIPLYVEGGMNVVYVGDVVRGMIAAASRGRPSERYILGGENLTHKQIFQRTARLVGGRAPVARLPLSLLRLAARAIEGGSSLLGVNPLVTTDLVLAAGKLVWFSCAKAERELGYTITPFDQSILSAYRWYVEHGML